MTTYHLECKSPIVGEIKSDFNFLGDAINKCINTIQEHLYNNSLIPECNADVMPSNVFYYREFHKFSESGNDVCIGYIMVYKDA